VRPAGGLRGPLQTAAADAKLAKITWVFVEWYEASRKPLSFRLDFGHSGINPLQTRQERAGAVRKFDEVWWEGRHREITPPPMPLP
jgi:hypothetical protein